MSNNEDELRDADLEIVRLKHPDTFIDMMTADAFITGQMNGKMPVTRHRLMFKKWLDEYVRQQTARAELEARIEELEIYGGSVYVNNRIATLKHGLEQLKDLDQPNGENK